ncbi:hypothetical protein ACX93W_10305 [Paenibacillus sp. CAU 1782]
MKARTAGSTSRRRWRGLGFGQLSSPKMAGTWLRAALLAEDGGTWLRAALLVEVGRDLASGSSPRRRWRGLQAVLLAEVGGGPQAVLLA